MFVLDLFKWVTTDPMTVLAYQSKLWKLLEKVNVSVTLALVPFHIYRNGAKGIERYLAISGVSHL